MKSHDGPDHDFRAKSTTMEVDCRAMIEAFPYGLAVYQAEDQGMDFTLVYLSPRAVEAEGENASAMLGVRVGDFGTDLGADLLATLQRVFITGESARTSAFLFRQGRVAGWLQKQLVRLPQSRVMVVYEDVTDLKRAEDSIVRIMCRRAELERIMDLSPAVLFFWEPGPGWPVSFVSKGIHRFGYSPEDFTEGRIKYAQMVHADDLGRIRREIDGFVADPLVDHYRQSYRIVTRSGSVRTVRDLTWLVRSEDGQVREFHGLVDDVTDEVV
ncbi:MAG: hypothetical protein EOM25_04815 [Deltaproteobacteria bacterium]|nr:hypothetical protein [Deltaproteobacteria bacterium]